MAVPFEIELTVIKVVTVALGGIFLWHSVRAYVKHRSRQMLILTLAVSLLTASAIVEGIAYRGLGLTQDESHLTEGGFTLVAFGVLVASLFVRPRAGGRV